MTDTPTADPAASPDHRSLRHFAACHSLVANEAQDQFRTFLGEFPRWDFSAPDATLTLGDHVLDVQLLGSHAYEPDTFLWAWGNTGYQGPEFARVTDAARWLRDSSGAPERHWQFGARSFPVGEELDNGGAVWPIQYAAFAYLRPKGLYSGDYGPGRVFFSIHDQAVPTPRPDPVALPRLFSQSVGFGASDRELVRTYAAWHGLTLTEEPDGGATLVFPGGSVVTFGVDARGSWGTVEATLKPGDVPGANRG